jgi:hypothetical protein
MSLYGEDVKAYTAKVSAETAKAQVFAAEIEGYANSIRGYTANIQGYSAKESAASGVEQERIRGIAAQMQASLAYVEKQVQQNRNLLTQYEVDSKMFMEDVELKKIQGQFEVTRLSADIQNQSKEIQMAFKEQELIISKATEVARILISALDGVARASSQAAAGAMGMVNVGATMSVGYSASESSGCESQFVYDM